MQETFPWPALNIANIYLDKYPKFLLNKTIFPLRPLILNKGPKERERERERENVVIRLSPKSLGILKIIYRFKKHNT